MRYVIGVVVACISTVGPVATQEVLNVFGPGGPGPAMMEAAKAFEKKSGTRVQVTTGPAPEWMGRARTDADLIFSGSENMMTSFVSQMKGAIIEDSIEPIYIRPSAILVRPGNPKRLGGVADLLKPGMRVLVVEGAGQVGLWEDVVGRLGRLEDIKAFRRNIVDVAESSGDAKKRWTSDPTLDAWLIWNIWEIANDDIADMVEVEPERRVWRDCGIAFTVKGAKKPSAKKFAAFLVSPEGRRIFNKWGWK